MSINKVLFIGFVLMGIAYTGIFGIGLYEWLNSTFQPIYAVLNHITNR